MEGAVPLAGSKNASLPIMAASLLSAQPSHLSRLPDVTDIQTFGRVMRCIGVDVNIENHMAQINPSGLKLADVPYDMVRTMRASIYVMGPMLSRLGECRISLPGGCAIGVRPVNYHLEGFRRLGASVEVHHGYIHARARKLKGAMISLPGPSVGATANLMMAASLAAGVTVINNAAREPEIVDLARAITAMGGQVHGAGSDRVEIQGVTELAGMNFEIMADRIETGTFAVAAAITGGNILLQGAESQFMEVVLDRLDAAGVEIKSADRGIRVRRTGRLRPVDIETQPYPGFPTDMQAQFMALMCLAGGTSRITEKIWENRFMHVAELNRMGANIEISGNTAIVRGVRNLSGASVMATDLRASAAMVLAALVATGYTVINRVYHIDRGYENIVKKFQKLGADIRRLTQDEEP